MGWDETEGWFCADFTIAKISVTAEVWANVVAV
jgi:hypothetical protein